MEKPELPKNGLLSGMVITWAGAAIALVVGFFLPEQAARLSTHPPDALVQGLGVTVALMVAHKLESWVRGEDDRCPVYLNLGRAPWAHNLRATFFVGFVGTLLGMLALVTLVMWGRAWPMLLPLVIWIFHSQHELHHLGKSLVERRYYPGTVSGLAFVVGVDALILPGWLANAGLPAQWAALWMGLHAPVLLAYTLEHRGWLGRGGAAWVGLEG